MKKEEAHTEDVSAITLEDGKPGLTEQATEQMAAEIRQDAPEVVQDAATAKEVINNYVNDPDVQETSLKIAEQFEKRFSSNWFTLKQVIKKTGFKDVKQALATLQVIILAGYCHATRNPDNSLKYRITIDLNAKLRLMEKEKEKLVTDKADTLVKVERHFAQANEALDNEIAKLKARIESEQTK